MNTKRSKPKKQMAVYDRRLMAVQLLQSSQNGDCMVEIAYGVDVVHVSLPPPGSMITKKLPLKMEVAERF